MNFWFYMWNFVFYFNFDMYVSECYVNYLIKMYISEHIIWNALNF